MKRAVGKAIAVFTLALGTAGAVSAVAAAHATSSAQAGPPACCTQLSVNGG